MKMIAVLKFTYNLQIILALFLELFYNRDKIINKGG